MAKNGHNAKAITDFGNDFLRTIDDLDMEIAQIGTPSMPSLLLI